MLARLLLREHFQILGSYFLPLTNTVILLEIGLFLLGCQTVPRKCESKHWLPCSADGRSFVLSVYGLEWVDLLTHGALHARPRAPLKLKLII